MKTPSALLSFCLVLGGCAGGSGPSTCEVFSPSPIVMPTSRDEQRIETQSTGDATPNAELEQDCP